LALFLRLYDPRHRHAFPTRRSSDLRRGVAQEVLEALEVADREFHMAVVALAGSVTLSATIDRLLTQLRLAFTGLNINPGIHGSFAQQNLAIIDRILNNQRVDASRGLHRYLDLAENMVIQYATADGKPVRFHVDGTHEASTKEQS